MPSDGDQQVAGKKRARVASGVMPALMGLLAVLFLAIGLLYLHYLNNPVTKYNVRDGVVLGEMNFTDHYAPACGGVATIWLLMSVVVLVKVAHRPGSAAQTATPVSAGWYPDPHGRHELRYWGGAEWTEHVSDGGETSVDG